MITDNTHFLAIKPTHNRPSLSATYNVQRKSPYFWWWKYLRLNKDYIKCCNKNGKGKLSKLYKDFGDVRDDNFVNWWSGDTEEWKDDSQNGRMINQRGQILFAENTPQVKVQKLNSPSDWQDDWQNNEDIMVVAVNLKIGKRALQKMFSNAINKEHKGKSGRQSLSKVESTAKYPLYKNFSFQNLEIMFLVYNAWHENSKLPKSERKQLWKIGDELNLLYGSISKEDDDAETLLEKHNRMASTVSRHVRKAKAIIANTAKGEFPNHSTC